MWFVLFVNDSSSLQRDGHGQRVTGSVQNRFAKVCMHTQVEFTARSYGSLKKKKKKKKISSENHDCKE